MNDARLVMESESRGGGLRSFTVGLIALHPPQSPLYDSLSMTKCSTPFVQRTGSFAT